MLVAWVLLLLATLPGLVLTDACADCTNSGKHWCATNNKCDVKNCATEIKRELNCPQVPDPAYAYDDNIARTKWLTLFGGSAGNVPDQCYKNQWPTMKLYNMITLNCSSIGPRFDAECHMNTAVDTTQKILVMSFRGTNGNAQMSEEILAYFLGKRPFFDSGYVFEYFYDAFMFLWNGGLGNDMKNLKYKYPDYELWVTGHSLGGALASVASSYVVKTGLFDPLKVKVLTVGQPRTGDYDYALWHSKTFPYSYRIVHHRDIVPHVPPQPMPDEDKMYHHRTEIWYNNNMTVGSPYNECQEADGPYCSNTQVDVGFEDHMFYYNTNLGTYGPSGCPPGH